MPAKQLSLFPIRHPKGRMSQILETIKGSPSSFGLEPYRVITITRSNTFRTALLPLMGGDGAQGAIRHASKLIVFVAYNESYILQNNGGAERIAGILKDTTTLTSNAIKVSASAYSEKMGALLKNNEPNLSAGTEKQTYGAAAGGAWPRHDYLAFRLA